MLDPGFQLRELSVAMRSAEAIAVAADGASLCVEYRSQQDIAQSQRKLGHARQQCSSSTLFHAEMPLRRFEEPGISGATDQFHRAAVAGGFHDLIRHFSAILSRRHSSRRKGFELRSDRPSVPFEVSTALPTPRSHFAILEISPRNVHTSSGVRLIAILDQVACIRFVQHTIKVPRWFGMQLRSRRSCEHIHNEEPSPGPDLPSAFCASSEIAAISRCSRANCPTPFLAESDDELAPSLRNWRSRYLRPLQSGRFFGWLFDVWSMIVSRD
jgi:hypothetical protein